MNSEPAKSIELRLNETCDYIKKRYGIDVTEARLRRWIQRGLISHSGNRIYLCAKRDWCWHVCQEYIDNFILALEK